MKPKPCPFCGKAPKVEPTNPARDGDAWGAVVCINKRCATYRETHGEGVRVGDGTTIADERGTAKYQQAAIRRWNTRR